MSVEIVPLRDRVLVAIRPLREQTGSLYRVNTLRNEYARTADVLAVGQEVRDFVPKQVVLLPGLVGQAIGDKGQMVPESSILATVLEDGTIRPSRGVCLVRKVETEETFRGGKIVLTESAREALTSCQVEVLAVGGVSICENEHCPRAHVNAHASAPQQSPQFVYRAHPPDPRLLPNTWAVVQPRSFIPCGEDYPDQYFLRTDDVLGILSEEMAGISDET